MKYGIRFTAVLCSFFCLTSAWADRESFNVRVKANVPSSLSVRAINAWTSVEQELTYNSTQNTLQPVTQQVQLKSGLGEIKAYLDDAALLSSGDNTIPLAITINGQTLDVGGQNVKTIVDAASAAAGQRVDFVIAPQLPGPYNQGNYTGAFVVIFESSL